MSKLEPGLTLRCSDPGFEHRVYTIRQNGMNHIGETITVQNAVKTMESKPTETIVNYLIKLSINGIEIHPAIREAAQILHSKQDLSDYELETGKKGKENKKALADWNVGDKLDSDNPIKLCIRGVKIIIPEEKANDLIEFKYRAWPVTLKIGDRMELLLDWDKKEAVEKMKALGNWER